MPKPRKADVERLRRLLVRWNAEERELQQRYGAAVPGSMRAGQQQDAAALASILALVDENHPAH